MTSLLLAVLGAGTGTTWNPPPPPPAPPPAVSEAAPLPEEPSRWPGPRTFGLRTGIGGGTATAGVDAGNVGVTWLINDSMAVSADLGLGLTATSGGGGANMALSALMAFYLGEPVKSPRIYVPLLFGVGIDSAATGSHSTAASSAGVFQLAVGSGIGAEYWLSKHFSFGAELMLRLTLLLLTPSGSPICFQCKQKTMFAMRSDEERRAARVAQLYRRFGGVIRARCRRILKNPSLADDAVQEVFLKVVSHLDGEIDDAAALRWIKRACVNHCLNELRSQGRHAEPVAELPERAGEHPEARLIERDIARRVMADSWVEGRAAALGYLQGLLHREIAAGLGVSRRTVLSRLDAFFERARWVTAELA